MIKVKKVSTRQIFILQSLCMRRPKWSRLLLEAISKALISWNQNHETPKHHNYGVDMCTSSSKVMQIVATCDLTTRNKANRRSTKRYNANDILDFDRRTSSIHPNTLVRIELTTQSQHAIMLTAFKIGSRPIKYMAVIKHQNQWNPLARSVSTFRRLQKS
jgi:hypothetical protein